MVALGEATNTRKVFTLGSDFTVSRNLETGSFFESTPCGASS